MFNYKYLFFFISICFGFLNAKAQSWSALGGGVNNSVNSLAYDSIRNILYASGQFRSADGKEAIYVASWDGTSWSPMGKGMDNPVRTLAFINDTLYAGGEFTKAGDSQAKCIAKWDGTNWLPMGEGMMKSGQHASAPTVYAITKYKDQIYAAGVFDIADGDVANFITRWYGGKWQPVSSGINGTSWIYALEVYNGELYAGGGFSLAGGKAADYIARWNGTEWSPVGGGLSGSNGIFAMKVYKNELYVTGGFTSAGGKPASYIAKWNGTNWSTLGSGLDKTGLALNVFKDELYVGGFLTSAGGSPAAYIAKWNGTNWEAAPTGTNGRVNALLGVESKNILYTGGLFTEAGGVAVKNVAALSFSSGINEFNYSDEKTINIYPNPVSSVAKIKITKEVKNLSSTFISIYNTAGIEVRRIKYNSEDDITFEKGTLPPGLYNCIVTSPGKKVIAEKFIIK